MSHHAHAEVAQPPHEEKPQADQPVALVQVEQPPVVAQAVLQAHVAEQKAAHEARLAEVVPLVAEKLLQEETFFNQNVVGRS